jgi:hypothetical protein
MADPVLAMDVDRDVSTSSAGAVYAGVGGYVPTGNRLVSFGTRGTNAGALRWRTPAGAGDVQTVHYLDGVAYFGFHDGLFAADKTVLAAADAGDGHLLLDANHSTPDVCAAANPSLCFLPTTRTTLVAPGFDIGLWAIAHYAAPGSGTRLIVGGEVGWSSGTSTQGVASFPSTP